MTNKRTVYGITELAEAIGQDRTLVSQWLKRGQLPEPTERLACGPVWLAEDVAEWIKVKRRSA